MRAQDNTSKQLADSGSEGDVTWPAPVPAVPTREAAVERHREEDFLRAAVEWVWETDADLRLTHVSDPITRSLGVPARCLIGRLLRQIGRFQVMPAAGAERLAEGDAALAAHQPFRDQPFVIDNGDGRSVTYRLSGVPFYRETDGAFAGFRGAGVLLHQGRPGVAAQAAQAQPSRPPVDPAPAGAPARSANDALVEEVQSLALQNLQLRLALQQRAEPPAAAEEGRQDEADAAEATPADPMQWTKLAHELRSPLNAIIGYAQLAEQRLFGPMHERYVEYLSSIITAASHLESVIASFSDSDSGNEQGPRLGYPVDLGQVFKEVDSILHLQAQKAGVDFGRATQQGQWWVYGDRSALVQIFVNLLGNAIKFTPRGGAVGLSVASTGPDRLSVTVWDEGQGIAPDELERIFEAGYRARALASGSTGHPPGQGLGLSIARDLARAFGGDIVTQSELGQGTHFVVTLRRAQSGQPQPHDATEEPAVAETA